MMTANPSHPDQFQTSSIKQQYIHLRHPQLHAASNRRHSIQALPRIRSTTLRSTPLSTSLTMPKQSRVSPPRTKSPDLINNTYAAPVLTLRIAGLGHHFEIPIESTATLLDLKRQIEKKTGLPPEYQRLVAKHKNMDDDSMVLGGTLYSAESAVHSIGIGLVDRTKILMMHSAQYSLDKAGVDQLNLLMKEIDEVDAKRISREFDNVAVHELITQLCCKIDGVETNGSEALRRMRKATIRRAEGVAKKSDESKRGIDP